MIQFKNQKYLNRKFLTLFFCSSFAFSLYLPAEASIPGRPEMGLFKKKKKKEEAPKDSTTNEFEKLTKGAIVQRGLFTVYKNKENYYFEIPDSLFKRDFLVINKLQRVPDELGEARANKGINYQEQMITFELNKDEKKLLVREVKIPPIVPEEDAIRRSVEDNYISPLIHSFKIEAFNKDSSAVLIKVNDIYNGSATSINNLFSNLNIGNSANKDLSRILSIKAFPNNVIAYSELSTKVTEGMNSVFLTVEVSSSIVLLPRTPMVGRLEDPRIGYFTTNRLAYSDDQQKVERKRYITRWRLEPKPEDREAYLRGELVEPQKPIVFYIDPATPEKWRKYMIQGVEDWQKAFEKAGFKNAIRAEVLSDSMAVNADDANTSVITYTASTTANAMGPSTCDPRSGEIIDADIIWWHNTMTILKEWITIQTGTVNPSAQLPILPDSLMGDAMRFVAGHEVGHSLGLRHNMRGSYAIPTDSLRSKTFTDKFKGTASSIMDYARYNYVAQPGDGVTQLAPQIGPYDLYAIEYGYRWYDTQDPEAEKATLTDFVSAHKGDMYAYSGEQSMREAVDPRGMSEDLGNDAVKSATYGIDNLKRIVPNILSWTRTGEKGQTYDEASALYFGVINQWNLFIYHVMANVGGMYIDNVLPGDGMKAFEFVPRDIQKKSLQFVMDQALTFPRWLFDTPISQYTYLNRNTPVGKIEESPMLVLKNAQCYFMWDLLTNERLTRMFENETYNGDKAFTPLEMMNMLHKHMFGITERGGKPDAMQRNLQKLFVDALIIAADETQSAKNVKKLTESPFLSEEKSACCEAHAHNQENENSRMGRPRILNFYGSQVTRISDIISLKRGELLKIRKLLQSRLNTSDETVRNHYQDMLLRINDALGLKN